MAEKEEILKRKEKRILLLTSRRLTKHAKKIIALVPFALDSAESNYYQGLGLREQ